MKFIVRTLEYKHPLLETSSWRTEEEVARQCLKAQISTSMVLDIPRLVNYSIVNGPDWMCVNRASNAIARRKQYIGRA